MKQFDQTISSYMKLSFSCPGPENRDVNFDMAYFKKNKCAMCMHVR